MLCVETASKCLEQRNCNSFNIYQESCDHRSCKLLFSFQAMVLTSKGAAELRVLVVFLTEVFKIGTADF